jgi:perosamine synthetase
MDMKKLMIPIAKPFLGEEEIEAVIKPLRSGWITQGPEVEAFENEFSEYVGAKYACAVSSCTSALHLALIGLGVGLGDEVITVSHSFIATANAIRYCGAKPVFIDIEAHTLNINPSALEAAISKKTKAILCVHQLGMPCNLRAILDVAKRNGLPVIEDAACAIGSQIYIDDEWQKIGRPHGDIACFSFHPRKILTTGEGGMLTTNNKRLSESFKKLRQHAMSVPDTKRHSSSDVIFEEYTELGFNYRMTDIQAAIGRAQLKKIPNIVHERRLLANNYEALLEGFYGVEAPREPEWAQSNWQSYCVRLREGCDQLNVMQSMLNDGIATRRGVMCIHSESAYSDLGTWRCGLCDAEGNHIDGLNCLVESESAKNNSLILPLFSGMTSEEQESVVLSLKKALES